MTLTRRFLGDDGGIYYVREVGDRVYWFGESLTTPGALGRESDARVFANVFAGRRDGNDVTGEWFDVPKGRAHSAGTLRLRASASDTRLERVAGDGGFAATSWRADASASRMRAASVFHNPGFQSTSTQDLSGAWLGDDGGIYYVRQRGNQIAWFGERGATWSNVFSGTLEGDRIRGHWADVPKAGAGGAGDLTLARTNHYQLRRESGTGGFGGTAWTRVQCKGINAELLRLTLHSKADLLDGDEPYLWTVWFKIDGDRFAITDVRHAAATVVSTSGSHGDLGPRKNLPAGTVINVPPNVGRFGTVLKTVRGLDPLSDIARRSTVFGVIVLAWEEDGLTDAAMEAGRRAFVSTLQSELDTAVRHLREPDQATLEAHLHDATQAAIKSQPIDTLRFLFNDYADDLIGQQVLRRRFDELRASETLRFSFREGANYELVGTLAAG